MSRYPEVITDALLRQYAHITDDEMLRDINETEREIDSETRRAMAQRVVADNTPHDSHNHRMEHFRADAYRDGVEQRRQFVAFLHRVLAARASTLKEDL